MTSQQHQISICLVLEQNAHDANRGAVGQAGEAAESVTAVALRTQVLLDETHRYCGPLQELHRKGRLARSSQLDGKITAFHGALAHEAFT